MLFFLTILFSFVCSVPVFATGEFSVTQEMAFTINQNLSTSVVHQVNITNNFAQLYPKNYSISLQGPPLKFTSASSGNNYRLARHTYSNNTTNIELVPTNPGMGKNAITKLELNYTIDSFVTQKGKTYEIVIPSFSDSSQSSLVSVALLVPKSLGGLSFSSNPSVSYHDIGNQQSIHFNLTDPKQKTLLIFGNYQLMDFKLHYHLVNDSAVTTRTEIAIPPDTDNQTVFYRDISPQPDSIRIDPDGNWLSSFQLEPNTTIEVIATGQAKVFPSKKTSININSNDYLTEDEFWEVNHPQIAQTTKQLKNIKDVYDFTVKTLEYDHTQTNNFYRKGAIYALNHPSNALCTEFSDLFVTLARAINVPSREVQGYAVSNNQQIKPVNPNSDILHSWAQYYDSRDSTWVSVDPTWEKTTNGIGYFSDTDLSRITFVTHGLQSNYPKPAGAYKNQNVKTVFVDLATNHQAESQHKPTINISGDQLIITNPNGSSLNQLIISSPKYGLNQIIEKIPPFGSQIINLNNRTFFGHFRPFSTKVVFIISSVDNIPSYTHTIELPRQPSHTTILFSPILFFSGGLLIFKFYKKHEKVS